MTVQQAIDRIRLDFPDRSEAELLNDLQAFHDRACFDLRLNPATQTISTLVAGTRSYALAAAVSRVHQVRYQASATQSRALIATHRDELDTISPDWRNTNGVPTHFYLEDGQIGLYPNPTTSSSGGYPRLEVDYSQSETLVLGSTLPTLPSNEAWVAAGRLAAALRTTDNRAPLYKQMFDDEVKRLYAMVQNQAAGFRPRFLPNAAFQPPRSRR